MLTALTGNCSLHAPAHRHLIAKTANGLWSRPRGLISYVLVNALSINACGACTVRVLVDNFIMSAEDSVRVSTSEKDEVSRLNALETPRTRSSAIGRSDGGVCGYIYPPPPQKKKSGISGYVPVA